MGQVIPNKWKKHLVLVEFGLKKKEDLEKEINRYSSFHIQDLIEDIKREMEKNSNNAVYIISFIPISKCFKLPNFYISSLEDLEKLKTTLDEHFYDKFSEVWYCKKPFSKGQATVTGRILIDNKVGRNSIKYSHNIEQVWACNHREIERFNKNSNVTYMQASREGWGRHYKIEKINIKGEKNKTEILDSFVQSVKEIERSKEKIEEFEKHLKMIGIEELCLEYMFSHKGFSFIDWDTSDDIKVIDSIFPTKEKII